ncbi:MULTISPECIES: RNA polymerase sigma factor [Chryseobacterium]|uniref:RNA polymerase sigma factor n=2 Tax=Chryseobacterium aquaticum TaxID=452084 RepID=A0A848N6C8_9FLAO|nr:MULTISPECIES: RNA polymerase sigma factor [Chryseobacterium]NMR35946.1 RNA polymerase sigma factor [Chryseobacterium aquaticum]NRQ48021.1 RNA polymerase sigma factor [Chryseobacterium sp. C-204]
MNFEIIFYQHQKMVYNLALQYTQNTEDAEEITQDVFVKISQKMDGFKNESSLKTWIYRITINTSLDFLKSKNSKKKFFFGLFRNSDSENRQNELVDFNHPGVVLEQKEEVMKIFSFINMLPNDQKTVVILMKIEGNSQQETAEIMNISQKAVESLFQRAKKNLIQKLNQQKEYEN